MIMIRPPLHLHKNGKRKNGAPENDASNPFGIIENGGNYAKIRGMGNLAIT
jgi:hypothetical protein